MKFRKYPSLISPKVVDKARLDRNEIYRRSEKIHGANFCLAVNYDSHHFQSRNNILPMEDECPLSKPFLALRDLVTPELIEHLRNLFEEYPAEAIYAYGEFFGHKVQKMNYRANLENRKEIKLFNVVMDCGDYGIVVGWDNFSQFIPEEYRVKSTGVGSLDELLEEDFKDESEYGGHTEGDVLVPFYDYQVGIDQDTGSFQGFKGVKKKTEAFLEKTPSGKTPAELEKLSHLNKIKEELAEYVTEARVRNVLSHDLLEITKANFGKIISLMIVDIKKEYENVNNHSKEDINLAIKKLGAIIAQLLTNMAD